MRHKCLVWSLALGLALGLAGRAASQELTLVFDFDAAATPPATSFLVTTLRVTAPRETTQFRLPNSGRASCNAVSDPTLSADSQCGRTPECLAPGIYSFWVQAEWETKVSPMSNVASCEALPTCKYNCATLEVPPDLQALITAPDGSPKDIDQAAIDQFVAQRAPLPPEGAPLDQTGPPPVTTSPSTPAPSVTTRAPTVDDVPDTITPALRALPPLPG